MLDIIARLASAQLVPARHACPRTRTGPKGDGTDPGRGPATAGTNARGQPCWHQVQTRTARATAGSMDPVRQVLRQPGTGAQKGCPAQSTDIISTPAIRAPPAGRAANWPLSRNQQATANRPARLLTAATQGAPTEKPPPGAKCLYDPRHTSDMQMLITSPFDLRIVTLL